MMGRSLLAVIAASLLVSCDVNDSLSGVNYAHLISDRAFAHGEGEATVSQVFGVAPRTCIGIGDREEAEASLDLRAQQALNERDRNQYSVVIVQFDEAGRATVRRQFHIRNAFVYFDVDEPGYGGSAARCLAPSDVIQVGLNASERMAVIRIP